MKKSYDYFKTLKDLAFFCENAFTDTVRGTYTENIKIPFFGLKNELTDSLQNDFITPIERGDIFVLADCLSRELLHISDLCEFVPLFWDDCYSVCNSLSSAYKKQTEQFNSMSASKDYSRLFSLCGDGRTIAFKTSSSITHRIKICVSGTETKPLLKYSVYAALLEVSRGVQYTFSQIERILLNNS